MNISKKAEEFRLCKHEGHYWVPVGTVEAETLEDAEQIVQSITDETGEEYIIDPLQALGWCQIHPRG